MEPDGMCQGCYDKAHPVEANIRTEAKKKKADEKKALLKKLRDADKERYKTWKMIQKMKSEPPYKMLTYKEWKAKKIADGTWEERGVLSGRNWT